MFEKLKYRRETRGFFNPDLTSDISREQFLQILSGDIINPNRLRDSKIRKDYSFMIVGVPVNSPLNSWAGQRWGANSFDNVQSYSDWYAKICCENDSYIVFPKQNLFFYFDPHSEYHQGKNFKSTRELELTIFDGHSLTSLEKDLRILISDLSVSEVLSYMRDYKRRFNGK